MMNPMNVPSILSALSTGAKKMWEQLDNRAAETNKLSVSTILMLDPITTVIRLGILKYKPESTKIGVIDNKLVFYEPTVYQGISRWWSGDSRMDVQYLYLPVLYFACIKHGYVESVFDDFEDKDIILQKLSDMALEGLKSLRSIYNHQHHKIDAVTNMIDSYIHLLTNKTDNSEFVKEKIDTIQNTIKLTFTEFTKEWKESYIKIILNLIEELDNEKDSDTYNRNIISTVETMLSNMDQEIDKCRS